MDIQNIYAYKNINTDILPDLVNFSKFLNKPKNYKNITIYQRDTPVKQDITILLNKLCKSNINIICQKLNKSPETINNILNYNFNYNFDEKFSFNKAECITQLLLAFNDTNVNKYVINTLQTEFNNITFFVNKYLVIVREFFIQNILNEKIFILICETLIKQDFINGVIYLLRDLPKKNIINILKSKM